MNQPPVNKNARYKPHDPTFYKTAWSYALTKCIEKPSEWVSLDWAKSVHSAQNRMERLRAFRNGIIYSKGAIARFEGLGKLLDDGFEIRFRKQLKYQAYDIQIALQPCKNRIEWIELPTGK